MRVGIAGLSGLGSGFATASLSGDIFHPLFHEPLKYEVREVGDDPDEQVEETIGLMRRYAREDGTGAPEVVSAGRGILAASANNEQAACGAWQAARSIGFLRDEYTSQPLDELLSRIYNGAPVIEVLIRPRDMASMKYAKYGDCDDFSMYAASLLVAMDIPCAFVTLAGDDRQPGVFSHVYVAAYPDGKRIAIDASHGEYCGWEANKPFARKKEWPINMEGKSCNWLLWIAAIAAAGFVAWTVAK